MRIIERFFGALLLAGAVAGAAAFGHLLGRESISVPVTAPTIPTPRYAPHVVAVKARPAPPLPELVPAAHRPVRPAVVSVLPARAVLAPAPAAPAPAPVVPAKPITIHRLAPKPPLRGVVPAPAPAPAPQPAAPQPVAAPATTALLAAPAPAAPAPQDTLNVLAATETGGTWKQNNGHQDNGNGQGDGEHGNGDHGNGHGGGHDGHGQGGGD
jgi:hypothetical protein